MDLSQLKPISITLDSNEFEAEVVNDLVESRVNPQQNACPTLTPSEEITSSSKVVFKRFSDQEEKKSFQKKLLAALQDEWSKSFGTEDAKEMVKRFTSLSHDLEENGGIILGSLISKEKFEELISRYSGILSKSGNDSWIHNFVNLAQHVEFLTDIKFNEAFLHPLLLTLISYQIGGAIRMIDARAKNAEALKSVTAGDNMLHIDNTPFRSEFKIILTWEKDQPRGPKGQNLVFLPGTNKGVRKIFTSKEGVCWSTENYSIFTNNESVESVLAFQKKVRGSEIPAIVEVTHDEKPLTTIFDAASVVHHRYRSQHKPPRSCIILAFHRIKDNHGQLIASEDLNHCNTLTRCILGHKNKTGTADEFLQALVEQANPIAALIKDLYSNAYESTSEVISMDVLKIPESEIVDWKKTVTAAPNVEQKKSDEKVISLYEELSHLEFIKVVNTMMEYDKYGPLDLILYSDNHEEIRKWARNKVREIKSQVLRERFDLVWARVVQQPSLAQLLTPQKCQVYSYQLADISGKLQAGHSAKPVGKPNMGDYEHAFSSIQQLLLDLGEAIVRCDSRQTFLSTALFLFLACDLLLLHITTANKSISPAAEVEEIGTKLLENYISTAILIATQIKMEQ